MVRLRKRGYDNKMCIDVSQYIKTTGHYPCGMDKYRFDFGSGPESSTIARRGGGDTIAWTDARKWAYLEARRRNAQRVVVSLGEEIKED